MWTLEKLLSFTRENGDCLEWTRCLTSDGYPRLAPNVKVHRLVHQLHSGESVRNKVVMHTCDNPVCINPNHLELGTFDTNNKDRMKKDRSYRTVLQHHVDEVKSLSGTYSRKEIASLVGLDQRRVSEILTGKRGPDGRLISVDGQ